MDFQIRRISQWHHDVAVSIDGTRVDLGLHDEEQRKTLASTLREAADYLDPAATASHAADVEALRAFFRDVAELTIGHDVLNDNAVVYPSELGKALEKVDPNWTRAALKGDKP